MTVRSDGKWYVSIAYSIAEAMRKDAGAPLPNFGNGVAAKGEPSAKWRGRSRACRAALALDVERLVGLVSPGEGRALRDYAPLFLADAKAAADEARRSFSATVNKLTCRATRAAQRPGSSLDAFDIAVKIEGETGRFAFEGECMTVTIPGERPQKTCAEDALKALPFFAALPEGSPVSTRSRSTRSRPTAPGSSAPPGAVTAMILDTTKVLDRESLGRPHQGLPGRLRVRQLHRNRRQHRRSLTFRPTVGVEVGQELLSRRETFVTAPGAPLTERYVHLLPSGDGGAFLAG